MRRFRYEQLEEGAAFRRMTVLHRTGFEKNASLTKKCDVYKPFGLIHEKSSSADNPRVVAERGNQKIDRGSTLIAVVQSLHTRL